MIMLTRLAGTSFLLNADLIERVDSTPDTIITLVDGKKYVVAESMTQVLDAVVAYRGEIVALGTLIDAVHPAVVSRARTEPAGPSHPHLAPVAAIPTTRETADGATPAREDPGGLMDAAAPIGIGLAFVVLIVSNVMEGGSPTSLLLLPPMFLVFATTLLVTVAGGTMADAKNAFGALKRAFSGKIAPAGDLVPAVVSLAEKARREGLLALEDGLSNLDDPFLVKGVTMAIDGTDPEELRDILEGELYAKKAEDRQVAKFYADAGGYAPTIGIIGTVMGLVHVLENLSTPDKLGPLIAGAFVATLWGVMSANVLWLPISNRLKRIGGLECARMEMAIEGVAAIQAGANPRLVAEKLKSLLPAGQQVAEEAA